MTVTATDLFAGAGGSTTGAEQAGLAADIATRLIAPERDLKLGVLTAIVGAPFFLHLIWKLRRVEA